MSVKVDHPKCIGCGMCSLFCPVHAASVSGPTFQCEIDLKICTQCLLCIDYCPAGAIWKAE